MASIRRGTSESRYAHRLLWVMSITTLGLLAALISRPASMPRSADRPDRPQPPSTHRLTPAKPPTALAYAMRQPALAFEPNVGQTGRQAKFLAHGAGYALFLTEGGAVLKLARSQEPGIRRQKERPHTKAIALVSSESTVVLSAIMPFQARLLGMHIHRNAL